MPPKKAKAQPGASSQPLPASSTRATGRKRRLSDASNASDRPASLQSAVPGKRRKRGRPTAASTEPEAIEEEEAQELERDLSAHHHVALQMGGDATYERTVEETIEVSQPSSKHVRFGSEEVDGNGTTATNITPHPRKMSVKRRFTLSPAVGTTKRIHTSLGRSSLGRASLPAAMLQGDSADPVTIIQELQFTPLRTVLDERVRRRLRRSHLSEEQIAIEDHERRDSRTQQELQELRAQAGFKEERISELALELETQRQFAIDVSDDNDGEKIQDLERELLTMRHELANHRQAHGLDADLDMPDNDMLVLDSQEEIAYPSLPATGSSQQIKTTTTNGGQSTGETKTTIRQFSSSTTGRSSLGQSRLLADWEAERREFQNAILKLHEEANDAKARMEILRIELHGLGFGTPGEGEDSLVILRTIRQSFETIRESLESTLPDTVPENASTQDIIEILIANVEEFADRLRSQDAEVHEKTTLIADLGHQIQGLLDHLADAEIRKSNLHQRWQTLDQANESKARDMEELEEELQATQEERDDLVAQLAAQEEEARLLGRDHSDSIKSLEKLKLSLENYRVEETRLTELISRMESDHLATVTAMKEERDQAVQELEDKLENEAALREEAEKLVSKRLIELSQLEVQLDDMSAQRDGLLLELEDTKADRDAVLLERDTTDADLEEKTVQIENLEGRVERLEDDLEQLTAQLDELRKLNETERRQREAAETELDDRNAEIDSLNIKLHDQGKEANELRLKLFEVQQQNAQKVKELEQLALDRDDDFQLDIAAEVTRRQAAEELAAQRAAVVLEVETRIEEIELQMQDDLAQRDQSILVLEDEAALRNSEIDNLRMDLESVENTLDVERTNFDDRAEELNASIKALQQTIDQHVTTIQRTTTTTIKTTELHNSEIEDRNAEIAELHADIAKLQTVTDALELQKAGLERRVEQEAEAMLELQNEKEDEIDSYKATIRDKQAKILIVEEKAIKADEQWTEVLDARDEQIAQRDDIIAQNEELIAARDQELAAFKLSQTTFTTEIELSQNRFRDYITHANSVIAKLRAGIDTAKTVADDEGAMLKADGDALLEELEAMDVVGQLKVTRTTTSKMVMQAQSGASASHSSSATKGRGRKSRRGGVLKDSGIGMDGEVEEEIIG
ncbi:hypothetical protein LTR08_003813 [Meristemomyces frigidus]|nr:hypothetical protein LTR08_003813 [Meristemomyces frigidus]